MDKWKVIFGLGIFAGVMVAAVVPMFLGKESDMKGLVQLAGMGITIAGAVGIGVKKKKGP